MKKIKLKHSKPKNRSSSVLNWTIPSKINPNNKKISQNKYFRQSSTIGAVGTNFYSKSINPNKTKNETISSLFKDLQLYKKQKERQNSNYRLNIKDIDIIKEKENSELLNKVSNYLEHKKEKVSLLDRLKEPNLDNLKKLLHESKSEQNILTKTFSTKFIGNEEYNTLSKVFGKGHSKKIGVELKKNDDKYEDLDFLKTKTQLFSKYNINPGMTVKEKEILNSISKKRKKKVGVSSKVNYYTNQFDSFKALQINRNLYNQLILKQEKEQIKQFLKNELQNEQ